MSTEAMSFETKQAPWWLALMGGILNVVIGILLLTVPALLVLFLGIQGLIVGIVSLVLAFKGGGWGAGILGDELGRCPHPQ